MGRIQQVQCTACGYQKDLYIGGGLADCSFDTVCSALSEEKQRMIQKDATKGISSFSIDRVPCRCRMCHTFFARPVVTYTVRGRVKTIEGKCPVCGGLKCDELSGADAVPGGCPDCGKDVLLRGIGHWD